MQIKKHYLKKMCTWLLPFTCILCHHPSQRHQDLCDPCHSMLPLLTPGCLYCAIPLPQTEWMCGQREPLTLRDGVFSEGRIAILPSECEHKLCLCAAYKQERSSRPFQRELLVCGQCLQKTPPFDATHALYSYQQPLIKLILELKFNQALVNARLLGEQLAAAVLQVWYKTKPLPNLIIPIPLHPTRLKERGFNQALEIARPIANMLKLPIDTTHCHRSKSTAPQATLLATERRKNVKGAFSVTENFTGQHVAVIDDVITTGSTVTEFCKVLKQHGVQKIDVWCCARSTR